MFGFGPKVVNISTAELQKRLSTGDKPVLIDVREPWEYAEGHIPGSVLRPLDGIRTWVKEFKKDAEVVVYCRTASRSAAAAQYMQNMGFTNVKNMSGGIIYWRGAVER